MDSGAMRHARNESPAKVDSDELFDKFDLPSRIFPPGSEPDRVEQVLMYSNLSLVKVVEGALSREEFSKIRNSFLAPIVKLGMCNGIQFSAKLFHFLMQRRILAKTDYLWFAFSEQPMRFSLREFFMLTGLPCGESEARSVSKSKHKPYKWMAGDKTVKNLVSDLVVKGKSMQSEEKIAMGMVILVEGILMAQNPVKKIPRERLLLALDFSSYCSLPWGKYSYEYLVSNILKLSPTGLSKKQYEFQGFALAIHLWALSAVPQLGLCFATRNTDATTSYPLCLHWASTRAPRFSEVVDVDKNYLVEVIPIIGDSTDHNTLVSTTIVDTQFEGVVRLVQQGYRMKKEDWVKGFVDIFSASEEIANRHRRPDPQESNSSKLDRLLDEQKSIRKTLRRIEQYLRINSCVNNQNGNEEMNEQEAAGEHDERNQKGQKIRPRAIASPVLLGRFDGAKTPKKARRMTDLLSQQTSKICLSLISSVDFTAQEPSPPPLPNNITLEDGSVPVSVHYPSIDSILPSSDCENGQDKGTVGVCAICLDVASEAVCVPCGHVAGCVSCLTEIKGKNWGCPVCRANIDQVIKLYPV